MTKKIIIAALVIVLFACGLIAGIWAKYTFWTDYNKEPTIKISDEVVTLASIQEKNNQILSDGGIIGVVGTATKISSDSGMKMLMVNTGSPSMQSMELMVSPEIETRLDKAQREGHKGIMIEVTNENMAYKVVGNYD